MQKIDFDDKTVINNFLPCQQFAEISSLITNSNGANQFAWYPWKDVASRGEKTEPWAWYAVNALFDNFRSHDSYYETIGSIFLPKFIKYGIIHSLIRIKANMFPYTPEVRTHSWHKDYDFDNKAAVFSLNTCDGYTSFKDGTKVKSIANQIVFFKGNVEHCSSTTSSNYARFNINFNFL